MFSPNHYLVRIGDSKNFWNSSPIGIWGMKILNRGVKPGDILWFIRDGGKAVAVAKFKTIRGRTYTDEELGWSGAGGWTKEILYQDLYDIRSLDLQTKIKGQQVMRRYNPERCKVDLIQEYTNIVRYSQVVKYSVLGYCT